MQRGFHVYVAALDLLKANMWPRHWLITLFIDFFYRCWMRRGRSRSFAIRGIVWARREHRSTLDGRDLHHDLLNIGRRWQVVEEPYDRGPIEPRSSCDRGAIEPWSHIFHRWITPTGSDGGRPRSRTTIDARSWPDRGPIVAQSCHDRGSVWSEIQAQSSRIWRHNAAQCKPLPRRFDSAPSNASIAHDLRANSPFKKPCISSLFFNFSSIREGIKRISRKIFSSSWSPRV